MVIAWPTDISAQLCKRLRHQTGVIGVKNLQNCAKNAKFYYLLWAKNKATVHIGYLSFGLAQTHAPGVSNHAAFYTVL